MHLQNIAGTLFFTGVFTLASSAAEADVVVTGKSVPSLAGFDRAMIALIQESGVPGGTLAVAKDGRVLYRRGFGYADRDKKVPVEPTSLFRIASISKPITAVAVLQLVEKKQLRLDDKVFEVLKLDPPRDVSFDMRWEIVTIQDLLRHTGGWDSEKSFDPMFRSPTIVEELKIKPPADQAAIIRYMLRRPLQFDPGTQHHYSNFGYCLLGRVIEKVSGMP